MFPLVWFSLRSLFEKGLRIALIEMLQYPAFIRRHLEKSVLYIYCDSLVLTQCSTFEIMINSAVLKTVSSKHMS